LVEAGKGFIGFAKRSTRYARRYFQRRSQRRKRALGAELTVLSRKNNILHDPHKETAGPLLEKVLSKSTLDTGTFKEMLLGIARMRNRLTDTVIIVRTA